MTRFVAFLVPLAFLGLGAGLQQRPASVEAERVAVHAAMAPCGTGRRITCVVDGDTFWLRGEKIRIANIDAPEVKGRCPAEREQARRATLRLTQLLRTGELSLDRQGTDRHGRSLARVKAASRDIGDTLVGEGLARPWRGRMEVWCG